MLLLSNKMKLVWFSLRKTVSKDKNMLYKCHIYILSSALKVCSNCICIKTCDGIRYLVVTFESI